LPDVTTATSEAALYFKVNAASIDVGVFATKARAHARLGIYERNPQCGANVYDLTNLTPAMPFTHTLTFKPVVSDFAALLTDGGSTLVAYNITDDGRPPVATVEPLPAVITQTTFTVTLSGSDPDCIRSFDVQVRDGFSGEWMPWLVDVVKETYPFTGVDGHTYFFRARARDLAGNQSGYTDNSLGDAYTTVSLTPAAVMELSNKIVPRFFSQGQAVNYLVELRNTGNVSALNSLTDTVPVSMGLIGGTLTASAGPAPQFDGVRISWQGTVTNAQSVFISYALTPTVELARGTTATNTAVIVGGVFPVTRTALTTLGFNAYLPLILRGAP
jgi:uncharacterized repeat protein (TIGR01451 family)